MTEIDTEPSSPLKGWPLQLLSHFSYFLRSLYNLHVRLTKVKTQPSTPRKSVVACRLGSETFEFDIKEADTSRSDEGLEMSVSLSFHDENLTRQFCPSITASPLFCPPRECLVTGRSISTARYYFQSSHTVWSTPVPLGSNTMTGASESFWTHHNLPQGSNTALHGGTSVSREGRVVTFSVFA